MQEPAAALPPKVVAYKRTPEFSENSIPAGLLREHSTKEGVWGLIHVVTGELRYRITDKRRFAREYRLVPGINGIVEPGIIHLVEARGSVRFFVEFCH